MMSQYNNVAIFCENFLPGITMVYLPNMKYPSYTSKTVLMNSSPKMKCVSHIVLNYHDIRLKLQIYNLLNLQNCLSGAIISVVVSSLCICTPICSWFLPSPHVSYRTLDPRYTPPSHHVSYRTLDPRYPPTSPHVSYRTLHPRYPPPSPHVSYITLDPRYPPPSPMSPTGR